MSSGVQDPTESSAGSATEILAWEDDPGQPESPNEPVGHPLPEIGAPPFPSAIDAEEPRPGGAIGTPEFRYWAAADALRRAADFWGGICGESQAWHSSVGSRLTVELDAGEDLNAFYDREGLKFFHEAVAGETFYSGESPDVVCHEFGHAVLDALQPRLWDVHSAEPPALHEAFGDMSAMLSALQLPPLSEAVIAATSGKLDRSSRLSRLAEQLGWAIRQAHPDVVEADCLRNASNSFFYQDPIDLPPRAPASELSSEPHSFSRVFSGAFLEALAGMFAAQPASDAAALEKASQDASRLLVEAARHTPVTVSYFSQFAAHMIAAERALFGGSYAEALRRGFVSHGVLALSDATSAPSASIAAAAVDGSPAAAGDGTAAQPPRPRIALSGEAYGLGENLLVHAADQPARFNVRSAAPDGGQAPGATHEDAAAGFVADLFHRGHVAIDPEVRTGREVATRSAHPTHEVRREDDALVLVRRLFHCGWRSAGE